MKKGGEFEDLVQAMINRSGLGMIQKAEPPVRVLRPHVNGQFIVTFLAGGILDFCGPYNGRYVEFDAKDIMGTRLTFSRYFKPSQIERIKRLHAEKAVVFVVIRFRAELANDDRIICIPGLRLIYLMQEGKKGLSLKDVERDPSCACIKYGDGGALKSFIDRA